MLRNLPRRVPALRRFSSKAGDVVYVDPSDPNVDTKQFFEYQTGRWLENDKLEREQRTTKFSLNGLVDVLKQKVDYLEKTPEHRDFGIATIEPYFEGKHNKLYKMVLKDMRTYILRIPYPVGHAEYREKRLLSEVATMDFMRKKHDMRLPNPVAWEATAANPADSPFIVMDYVKGDKLMGQWKPWVEDMQEKAGIIKPAADFVDKMVTTQFSKYGALYFTEDVDAKYQSDLPYAGETDTALADRWRIGPTVEKRFWKGRTVDVGAEFRGPWESYNEYLLDTARVQRAYVDDWLAQKPDSELLQNAKKAVERYEKVVPSLFVEGELDADLTSPRLHHPDISPLNMIGQDNLSRVWLIDFENTAIRPFMLHGLPWFVRNPGEKIYKKEEVPNYDALPEHERAIVDHYIRLTQNEFTFEYFFHKLRPTLFQALNPSIKRREETVSRALACDIDTGFYNDLDFSIYKLSEMWNYLNLEPPREFPVKYTEAELETISNNVTAWNSELTRNPALENKGFLSAREFDKHLGEGNLVPKGDGSYEFTPEFLDKMGNFTP